MAIRDAIVLNTTGSNFEALQSGDTVRIKGDSSKLLSVENSSATSIFSVGTSNTSLVIEGNITSSKLISGSSTSTASFGRFVAATFDGDGRELASTLPRSAGLVSGSAQISGDVSGSFTSGFTFGATANQLYVGVSGSNSSHSASISGSTRGIAASGSDFAPQSHYEFGHIRGVMSNVTNTFSVGGNLGVARYSLGGAGIGNAALAFAGQTPVSPKPRVTCTEEYNGSVWSTANVLNTAGSGHSIGTGIQNAALVKGRAWGSNGMKTEGYDGNTWSQLANSADYGFFRSTTGTFNAALSIGGRSTQTHTEHFNGTSWSEGGTLSAGRYAAASIGLENAALAIGGAGPPSLNFNNTCTEHYNGTTWSVGGARITSNSYMSAYGGENEAAIVGGHPSNTNVQYYDGTAWTAGTATPNGRYQAGFSGTVGDGITFGGLNPSGLSTTETFEVQYTTTGSFGRIEAGYILGSGEDIKGQIPRDAGLVTSSAQLATDISGSFTSGFNFGGTFESRFDGVSGSRFTPGVSGSSQFYSSSFGHPSLIGGVSGSHPSGGADYSHLKTFDSGHIRGIIGGGSWSTGASMINARAAFRGSGMYDSALVAMDQFAPHASSNTATEEYEGIAWAAGGAANRDFSRGNQVGFVNAAVKWGGYAQKCETEEYNGTVWSNASNMSNGQNSGGAAGTQNAALAFQGRDASGNNGICTEEYNGTSWSTSGAVGSGARYTSQGFGSQNSAVAFGNQADTHLYDGSAWSTLSGVAAAHPNYANGQSVGTQTGGLAFGGGPAYAGSANTTTFQFDGSVWSSVGTMITFQGHKFAGGAGDSHRSLAFGGNADSPYSTGGGGNGCTRMDEWDGNFINTGSFGRIEVTYFDGDATSISGSLADSAGVKTSSEGFQSEITGSIRGGISLKGPLTSQPVGAWTQVASSRVGGSQHVLIGTKNSAIKVGGGYYSPTAEQDATERYDGIAWSDFVRLPNTFTRGEASGQVDSELVYGGIYSGSSGLNVTLSGNGTSFNQEAYMVDYGQNRSNQKGGNIGTQNAALATTNNHLSPGVHKTQVYDGNSWSILPSHANSSVDAGHASTGVVNAAILTGGNARCKCSEIWDGTSWGVGPSLIQGKCAHAIAGGVNDALTIGSYAHPAYPQLGGCTQLWDGVAWSSTAASGVGFHNRGDSNLNTSDGAISHGGHEDSRNTYVWDTYYVTSGSFWKVEPKYGIETERFELKGKFVNDENTLVLLQSNTVNDSVNISGSMGDTSYTASLGNYHSASFVLDAKHTGSAGLITDAHPPKFGRSSFYMDGSGGITISGSADGRAMNELAFGTGDFTVEYWVRFDDITTSTNQQLVDFRQAADSETQIRIYTDGSGGYPADLRYYIAGADRIDVANILKDDVWQHHALVRYDGVTTLYIDGKPRGTYTDTNNITVAPNAIHFGRHFNNNTNDLHGQMDTIRVSNIARYTVPFIPEEGEIERFVSGSITHSPYTPEKIESTTFKLPQFSNFDQPAILTQTLFQTNFSSSLSTISGSRTGRSGSGVGKYGNEEENIGTVAGDMWFNRENNSLNFTFESSSYSNGIWAAGGAVLINNCDLNGVGLQNAALAIGGANDPDATQHYDGAAWSLGGLMINNRFDHGAAGSQAAALAIGGNPGTSPNLTTATEHYDGHVWSAGGALPINKCLMGSTGTQNVALTNGGKTPSVVATTEEYDGSSWTSVGSMNTARYGLRTVGQQYQALTMGGNTSPAIVDETEEYNGSVWTEVADVLTDRELFGAAGDQNDSVIFGGRNPSIGNNVTCTEEWNGIGWSQRGTLIAGRRRLAGAGKTAAALAISGDAPGHASTEEYAGSGIYKNFVICALTGSQA